MDRRDRMVWCAATVVLAFFTIGGWYVWHGNSPTTSVSTAAPPSSDLGVLAAEHARAAAGPGTTRLMLVGNSVAYELARGFEAQSSLAVFDAAIPACAFPPTVSAAYRNPATNQMLIETPCHPTSEVAELAAFRPRVALWIANDSPEPWTYHGRTMHACSQSYGSIYKSALNREITRLRHGGATVAIATEAYVRFTRAGAGLGAVALPDRTVDCDNQLRRAVAAAAHVKLIDLFGYTCPHGTCRTQVDGVVLRPDGEHYQGQGATVVARWIAAQLT